MFTILVVDDNPNDRKGITGLMDWSEMGIEVIATAVNGLDGYQKAITLRPDFILTDISMPNMDGIEMTKKIKEELPDTRFVFMSCYDDFEYMQNAINMEVSAYILKPIDLLELKSTISKMQSRKLLEINNQDNELAMKKLLAESLPFLQEQFLKELLYTGLKDEQNILARADYLKMEINYAYYAVLSIQIDNYNVHFLDSSIEQKHSAIYQLQKIAEQIVVSKIHGYSVNSQMNSIGVIVFFNNENRNLELDKLTEATNNCIEEVNQLLKINITIGISQFQDNITLIQEMYSNSLTAAQSKFFTEGNRIIFYSEISEYNTTEEHNYQHIKQEINTFLEQEGTNAEKVVEQFLKKEVNYNEKYSKTLAYSVMNILQTILIDNNLSFKSIFEDEIVIWKKLSLYETIIDIRQLLINTINAVKNILTNGGSGSRNTIVEDLKKIIDSKFSEIENINQIVYELNISASYANLIFKQQTGQTIFDYLIWKRIEVAKSMLKDPYIKVYEIPEKIGYKTNAHFRAVFKQFTGKTPKQYQEMQTR